MNEKFFGLCGVFCVHHGVKGLEVAGAGLVLRNLRTQRQTQGRQRSFMETGA